MIANEFRLFLAAVVDIELGGFSYGLRDGIITDGDAFSQKDTGVEGDPISQSRMTANRHEWSDGNVAAQAYVRAFHDVFGDSGGRARFCEKLVNQPDKIELRVSRDQLGAVQIGKILGNDERRCPRMKGSVQQPVTGQQRQIPRFGLFEIVDACNTKLRRAMKPGIDGPD